ncbi:odorant receptor 94b [Aphomia sociella]
MSCISMSLAGKSVSLHLRLLRCCGFYQLSSTDDTSPLLRRIHTAYCQFTLAVTTVYLLQECVYAYQEQTDMDKLARVMFLLLCHVTSIAKQIVFYLDANRINKMIIGLDDRAYNEVSEQQTTLLRETSTSASRLLRMYSGCAVVTCTLWIVFPVMYYVRDQPVEFAFWAGVDYNTPIMFVFVLMYSYYVTTLVGIANTTMDAFMWTVLYQCQTQLKILRCDFTHFSFSTNNILQNIFGTAILIQFTIGGWILCMAAYKLVSLNVLSIEFASMTLFLTCILFELLLYCYFGNEVQVESDRMVESMYATQWLGTPVRFQRSLLIMMERAKRPLRPVAGRIVPLSLDTFVTVT